MNPSNSDVAFRTSGRRLNGIQSACGWFLPAAFGQPFRATWPRFRGSWQLGTTCLFLVAALVTGCGQEPAAPTRQVIDRAEIAKPKRQASTAKIAVIDDAVKAAVSPNQRRLAAVNAKLGELEAAIVSGVRGATVSPPNIFAADFSASVVDRARFESRYEGTQFAVQRWIHSASAPTITMSPNVIEGLIKSIYQPWQGCANFRLELALFTSNDGNDLVVATAFGDIDNQSGRQATSLWSTRWTAANDASSNEASDVGANDVDSVDLSFSRLKVIAQEEVIVQTPGGRLMQDCTASILGDCDALSDQLRYGIDQWARKVPGIDITGQHGIAVGDVNGDGLDDLYLCQPHGLPNLLLIQKPDGTVDDLSAAMKIDVLDDSRAALLVDLDNDADQDLVVATDETLLLFSQSDDNTFRLEHQLEIGRSTHSLSAADFDQDGDLDLFLCKYEGISHRDDLVVLPRDFKRANGGGRNVLLRNDEAWRFTDATTESGIVDNNSYFSRSASWTDIDFDGDQDLFVTNEFASDQLYRNDGGQFQEITDAAGATSVGRHRSVSCGDFNQDGRSDFFVATDFSASAMRAFGLADRDADRPDPRAAMTGDSMIWYATEQSSTGPGDQAFGWRPFALRAPMYSAQSSFGSSAVDLNNDGFEDIVVTTGRLTRPLLPAVDEGLHEQLFVARRPVGEGREIEIQTDVRQIERIIRETTDLTRAGHSFAGSQRNQCYLSIGRLGFAAVGPTVGFDSASDGRAVATTDWDNDGDADLVLTNRNGPQFQLLRNQLSGRNHYVAFRLTGTRSNADAIGAQVSVFTKARNTPFVKTVRAGSGDLAQSSKQILFGLGDNDQIERVGVIWPNGNRQTFSNIRADTAYQLIENKPTATENRPERPNLAIAPQPVSATETLPPIGRSLFNPPGLFSELEVVGPDGQVSLAIDPDLEAPTLLLVCDNQPASQRLIRSVAQLPKNLTEKPMGYALGIVDSSGSGQAREVSDPQDPMRDVLPPFRGGTLNAVSLQRLKLWSGAYFGDQSLPQVPFAILVNERGQANVFYPASDVADANFSADIQMASDPSEQRWNAVMTRPGRWFTAHRYSSADRLIMRLADLGDLTAANKLNESSSPHRAHELRLRAQESRAAGDQTAALTFFDRAVKRDPLASSGWLGLGELKRQSANELVVTTEQDSRKRQLQEEAIECFDRAIELDPEDHQAILGQAHIAIDRGQLARAFELLEEYAKRQPGNYPIKAVVGRLLFHQQQYAAAETWLVDAFDNHPTLPNVAGDLGYLYLKLGKFEQAARTLEFARRLQPSDLNIQQLQAQALFYLGDHRECVSTCEALLDIDANRPRLKRLLAWLSATSSNAQARDAQRAIKIMTPSADLYGNRSASDLEIYAAALAQDSQFEEAVDVQQQAIELVADGTSEDTYTALQRSGMKLRLEHYQDERPYRTEDPASTPLGTLTVTSMPNANPPQTAR